MNYDSTQGHKNNLRATYYAYPLLCICKEWKCKLFVGQMRLHRCTISW